MRATAWCQGETFVLRGDISVHVFGPGFETNWSNGSRNDFWLKPLNSIEPLDPAWVEDIPDASVARAMHFLSPHLDVLWFLFPSCFNFNGFRHMFIGFFAQIICSKSLGWMTFCDLWRSPGDDSDWTQWWRSCDWGAENGTTQPFEPEQSAYFLRWEFLDISRLWGCWLLVSVWDCLRKTQRALQSEATV